MSPPAPYDLTPAWQILAVGAVVAALPALWVLRRQRVPGRYLQALAAATLFLTLDLVLFGAFTRLTDSGLGCPDWPGCYGNSSPLAASAQIEQAQSAMPTGPVTHGKAWIEMVHRYGGTAIGALAILLVLVHWRQRRHLRAGAPGLAWSVAILLAVMLQGALGALTVTMKLFPAIVSLHLLGGVGLLALMTALNCGLSQAQRGFRLEPVSSAWRARLWLVLGMLFLQIALGGWVSTNYAVLACTDFPTCQGSWWPEMDFFGGYTLWHPLGLAADGSHLSFAALTAIHYGHRVFALCVVMVVLALLVRLGSVPALRVQALALGGLLLLQLATGLSNATLGWPLAGAVLHTGGAAGMVMVMVWLLCATRLQTSRRRNP